MVITGRNGHKAVVQVNISSMAALGGRADLILLVFQQFELPVSANAVEKVGFA